MPPHKYSIPQSIHPDEITDYAGMAKVKWEDPNKGNRPNNNPTDVSRRGNSPARRTIRKNKGRTPNYTLDEFNHLLRILNGKSLHVADGPYYAGKNKVKS